jgi:flagellar capping protein FliD
MNPIEQKEIRGLSIRTLITIITSTVVIVSFIYGMKYSIQTSISTLSTRIQALEDAKNYDEKILDLRMQQMEKRMAVMEEQLELLREFKTK